MFLDKLKKGLAGEHLQPSGPAAPPGAAPSALYIYRARQNFGVNFGSLFLQESFIFGKFFPDGSNTELSGVSAYIQQHGAEQTRKDLEAHWTGYVSADDWGWLQSVGVTAVRVPIGYWHVNGGVYSKGTPFEPISGVYVNAWEILKKLVAGASAYQIGVLIDLHALPGGANCAEHSGVQNKRAEFWSSSKYQKTALSLLEFIAEELRSFENVVGIQVVNECEFSDDAKSQRNYYARAANSIHNIDPSMPVVISDGWWTDQWVKWLQSEEHESGNGSSGIVIDTHVYRCFSDADKGKSPEQIIKDLERDVLTNLSGEADIIVGEYSSVLDGQSWDKTSTDRGELVKQYGQKQQELFRQRAHSGSFFWTFKFEHGDGGEWGFVPQVKSGAIPSPRRVPLRNDQQFSEALQSEYSQHATYWDNQSPSEKWEHWRYKEGFTTAWADASAFAQFGGSSIGRRCAWVCARRQEHVSHRGNSPYLWEWEHGFRRALELFQ